MKSISVLWYAIALIFPIILFTVILNNANETQHASVYVVCIALYIGAAMLSVPGKIVEGGETGGKLKWVLWSAVVGVAEALALIYMA